MSLSLAQTNYIAELADQLYDMLPGSSQYGAFTFGDAATRVGVGQFWVGGSKRPAITNLLERTLDEKAQSFPQLIETVVAGGLKYRRKKANPVTREEVIAINRKLRDLGMPYSKLASEAFLSALPTGAPPVTEPPRQAVNESLPATPIEIPLESLRRTFDELTITADRQAAGLEFEKWLTKLFDCHGLRPRQPFRVTGEQIDGSFVLDDDVYLIEAKWETDKLPEADLLVFRGKVEGKSAFTRGLFISVNGYSEQSLDAITRGKQPNFAMIDGAHLYRVLQGAVRLDDLLRQVVRGLQEQGRPYIPVVELLA